ncbi:hypothetical protein B0H11DRAFT_1937377 [Mycena galericulata]|nr:hypothetical protein B0H11DRAFT_1937377 [Mycena galericulata]
MAHELARDLNPSTTLPSTGPSGFMNFPIEMERETFEWAVFLHPVDRLNPMLVARRVQIWLERLLYRSILLRSAAQTELLLRTLRARSQSFRQNCIRNIAIGPMLSMNCQELQSILCICQGITTLAVLGSPTIEGLENRKKKKKKNRGLGLQRLTIDPLHMSRLVHDDWEVWAGLDRLALTHLAFHLYSAGSGHSYLLPLKILQGALRCCKSLQVLILLYPTRLANRDVIEIRDSRFCIDFSSDSVANWYGECRGGDHFWRRADRFTAKKKGVRLSVGLLLMSGKLQLIHPGDQNR